MPGGCSAALIFLFFTHCTVRICTGRTQNRVKNAAAADLTVNTGRNDVPEGQVCRCRPPGTGGGVAKVTGPARASKIDFREEFLIHSVLPRPCSGVFQVPDQGVTRDYSRHSTADIARSTRISFGMVLDTSMEPRKMPLRPLGRVSTRLKSEIFASVVWDLGKPVEQLELAPV